MINHNLSVVTVNFNNADGLRKTLESILIAKTKPKEIIVIDAQSIDDSKNVIESFKETLKIKFISEKDEGIYDGMNKGLKHVKTDLVHYLNSGDEIYGDIYRDIDGECLLQVKIFDENNKFLGFDFIKAFGTGYNHQGIIFCSNHPPYDLSYSISSDRDLIYKHFKTGLSKLEIKSSGGVNYYLGGISTERSSRGNNEIIKSLFQNKPQKWLLVLIYIFLKRLSFRWLRRNLYKLRFKVK